MDAANWTKNEEDVVNFADLVSFKMYYGESKVPNYIKAYMAAFYHYNFCNQTFDGLIWLTINKFLMIALNENKVHFIKSELCEDFPVKGAFLYRLHYRQANHEFYLYDISVNGHGVQPIDSLTRAIVTKLAKKGCGHCAYKGEDCSYCANGKLTDAIAAYTQNHKSSATFLSGEGWLLLNEIFGEKRTAALFELASFAFYWMTDEQFADNVLKNREDWAEKANLGEFLHDKNVEKYLISGDDNDLIDGMDLYDDEEDEE